MQTHGRRAVARKEAKDKTKVAKGHCPAWCQKRSNKKHILMKTGAKPLKNHLTMMTSCKGAEATGDQQTRQTKGEESQSCFTIECGEQSKFELNEIHQSERQVGRSQSHLGLWSCRTCHA